MANLTREQEAMNKAHSDDRRTCLPNCWRSHYGDPEPRHKCDFCDQMIRDDADIIILHNEYHLNNPESIK